MPNYDFSSLSSYDFEQLVRDLLQMEMAVTLESFKVGRDGGIDLRYARDPARQLVVQCKHYCASGYSHLANCLRRDERPKLDRLKPARYVLATSVGLTPHNKSELLGLLAPYCRTSADIFGRDDLNNLLGRFPDIERLNFKLWLTSQPILDRILHSAIFNRSVFEMQTIHRKLKYYVQNKSFFAALDRLEDLHYCIIVGIPGIGKTTLAEILLVHHLSQGFEAIKVAHHIEEAERVYNQSRLQIFYYDDFLGQTSLQDKLGKNEDAGLLNFVAKVQRSPHARFILTTREYILNQAEATYERLARGGLDTAKCVVDLAGYTPVARSHILYNHLYFSDIPVGLKTALLTDKAYRKLVGHPNFNPRVIEWMTDNQQHPNADPTQYAAEFLQALDKPTRIWTHAYERQISVAARHLLLVLTTMSGTTWLEDLKHAFDAFHLQQAKRYSIRTTPADFANALKELDGSFLHSEKNGNRITVAFHNPSIRDFMDSRLAEDTEAVEVLCLTAVFTGQLRNLWGSWIPAVRPPATRAVIMKNPQPLIARLGSPFGADHGAVSLTIANGNRLMFYPSDKVPYEVHAHFILHFAQMIGTADAVALADRVLETVTRRLSDGQGDQRALVSLVDDLTTSTVVSDVRRRTVVDAAKGFLIPRAHWVDEFDELASFLDTTGIELDQTAELSLKKQFEKVARQEASDARSNLEEPDSVRDLADQIERLAGRFGSNVDSELERLADLAYELESRTRDEEDHRYDDWKERRTIEAASEEEIDALFDSLRDLP